MAEHDLGALVCFVGENVRYITGVFQGNWKNNIFIRYCVLPRDGEPVLFETAGSDLECAKIDAPWLNGNIRPAITWKWAETAEQMMVDRMADSIVEVLKENGVEDEPIGVDIYDPSAAAAFERRGLRTTSAWPAMSGARVIKTPDEIECLKISSAIGDTSFWKIENEWLKPGVKESYITAKVNEYLYEQGFDFVYDIIVASGGNTSPYRRWHTDKVIRQGDLVIIDQNAVGPGGYFVDFVRTFKVDGTMTVKEQDLYKECYESMYAAIEQMKAGNTTEDVAKRFPTYADDEYGDGHPAAVRALDRALPLRGDVDLARLLARLSGRAQGGHVLRRRDVRRAPGPRADGAPRGEPAGHQGRAGAVHQAPVLRLRALLARSPRGAPWDGDQGPGNRPRLRAPRDGGGDPRAARSRAGPWPPGRARRSWSTRRATARRCSSATRRCTAPVVAAAAEAGCRIISRYGIGYDNIDVAAATERGLLVTYVPDYCLDEVADHAMALLLALARGVHHAGLAVRGGDWAVPQGAVHRLHGSRLAVIGVGGIGRRVVDRARAFGIEAVGVDPYLEEWNVAAERATSFADAVAEADFVSLHVPLTDENRHLIDAESIAVMRRAPIIVNTARGPLVDMDAAVEALDCRQARWRGARRHRGRAAARRPPAAQPSPRGADPAHGLLLGRGPGGAPASRRRGGRARVCAGEPPDRPVNPEVLAGS